MMNNTITIEVHALNKVEPEMQMRTNLRLNLNIDIDEYQFAKMIIKAFDDWDNLALNKINDILKTEGFNLSHND